MNEIDKSKLRMRLLEIYTGYIEDADDKEVKKRAQELFFEYIYMSDMLDKEFVNAVCGLEHIGWDFSRSTKASEPNWKMDTENAQLILGKLRG